MTVALIDGHAPPRSDLLAPVWIGTLDQFWAANEAAYTWDDLCGLAERLNFGHFVEVGEQTLCTDRTRHLHLAYDDWPQP